RVATTREDNRNRVGSGLGGENRRNAAARCDDRDLPSNEVGRQLRQTVVLTLRPAILDEHILTLNVTGFLKACAERRYEVRPLESRAGIEKPDHRRRRLLRPSRHRPRNRAADQGNELAASAHSMISSARASKSGGMEIPSTFAALRFITCSS